MGGDCNDVRDGGSHGMTGRKWGDWESRVLVERRVPGLKPLERTVRGGVAWQLDV